MDFCTNCVNEYAWRPTDNPFPKECKECEVVNGKPSNFKPKNKTNADRIRAMSDEELAEFIRDVSYECQDASWGCHCQTCSYPWCSSDQTAEWLKQPAEE